MKKEDLLLANLAAFMSHSSLSVTSKKLDHLIMLHLIALWDQDAARVLSNLLTKSSPIIHCSSWGRPHSECATAQDTGGFKSVTDSAAREASPREIDFAHLQARVRRVMAENEIKGNGLDLVSDSKDETGSDDEMIPVQRTFAWPSHSCCVDVFVLALTSSLLEASLGSILHSFHSTMAPPDDIIVLQSESDEPLVIESMDCKLLKERLTPAMSLIHHMSHSHLQLVQAVRSSGRTPLSSL
jgi:hypothetical protein